MRVLCEFEYHVIDSTPVLSEAFINHESHQPMNFMMRLTLDQLLACAYYRYDCLQKQHQHTAIDDDILISLLISTSPWAVPRSQRWADGQT